VDNGQIGRPNSASAATTAPDTPTRPLTRAAMWAPSGFVPRVVRRGGYGHLMRMSSTEARARFAQCPSATLGTVDAEGRPHLVPVTYVLTDDDHVYIAIDAKPKRTTRLQRLRNIAANPNVSLLADEYADDWDQLWWARADGTARVVELAELTEPTESAGPAARPDGLLAAFQHRYPWYSEHPPTGPVIDITVTRWSGWAFADTQSADP
jgi:PPOX class probable F420-dependent enzyme